MPDDTTGPRGSIQALAGASASVAWVVLLNKPFYPLYVWYFVGSGTMASTLTIASAPVYAAIAFYARRAPLASRIALPLAGVADTALAAKLFGGAAGAVLFLAPCAMIAALSFRASERWIVMALLALIYLAFVLLNGGGGAPLRIWSDAELSRLLTLNSFAVASLTAFVGWRYSGVARG